MPAERIGQWMQTVGGRAFYPLDPRPEEVDILDIAHALSLICRFGGHSSKFYSVAEHSLRVSMAVSAAGGTAEEAFCGLMHDATEAYCGDMVWPIKVSNQARGFKEVESLIGMAIAQRFALPFAMPLIVKQFDLILLSTEKRDLMTGRQAGSALGAWHSDEFAPLPEIIEPMPPETARAYFLGLFADFSRGRTELAR